ncbi:hypothetical protein G8E05_14820 [Clostridium botulinum]|uniref:YcxB family protein n=3 Tax=Clostridium botulinum TaxID=1491 RepID=A0A846I2R9_CLOBO|nr:hypothetical protein CLJ_B0653 [Clostridium botulinum Ba4 str. 657]AJD27478.1 hypothetical protein T257_1130 [Clostridium botulinum CDC_297]AJE12615.1 hypothetical protein T259_3763 [Clostridium botulinum CDC_1436]APR01562.1 hypothetical protein RSJ2_628 [Clostridium botulinum]EDT87459.1 hypothetical protein CBB_0670 [Clostridium botulinum Bf]
MTLNYILTREELFNFHKKYILNTMQYENFLKKLNKIYFFMGILIWIFTNYSMKFKAFIVIAIIGILLFILRKKIYMYKFDNELKKVYCDDKKRYLFDSITLEVKDEGIMLNTSMNDELIKWKGIKDFNIIDGNVFIRTFTKDNVFIPSSVIKSEEDLNLIKKLFFKYGQIKPKNSYPNDIQFITPK